METLKGSVRTLQCLMGRQPYLPQRMLGRYSFLIKI